MHELERGHSDTDLYYSAKKMPYYPNDDAKSSGLRSGHRGCKAHRSILIGGITNPTANYWKGVICTYLQHRLNTVFRVTPGCKLNVPRVVYVDADGGIAGGMLFRTIYCIRSKGNTFEDKLHYLC
jgi:hypothetical protein